MVLRKKHWRVFASQCKMSILITELERQGKFSPSIPEKTALMRNSKPSKCFTISTPKKQELFLKLVFFFFYFLKHDLTKSNGEVLSFVHKRD